MDDKQRVALNELIRGGSQGAAARAAGVSVRTIRRWASMPAFADELAEAKEKVSTSLAVTETVDQVRAELKALKERALVALGQIEEAKDTKSLPGIIREVRGCIMDAERMAGRLHDAQVNVAVVFSQTPEWKRLLGKLVLALSPYPEAKAAVLAAIESENAA